jgi:hypothetical protein
VRAGGGELVSAGGCGAPDQGAAPSASELAGQTLIQGTVTAGGSPVSGAYVRLLDSSGDFTAEVVAGEQGRFRFFARPGRWTLRALAPGRSGEAQVTAVAGQGPDLTIALD